MTSWLGAWRWYIGFSDDDDEMCECSSREAAIAQGRREYAGERQFYVVETRITLAYEAAMERGTRDTAPFAERRDGQFIDPRTGGIAAPL